MKDKTYEELVDENTALTAHVEQLESVLEAARDAIASLDIDALGSVPETHDCPAYPIRDAVTNDLTVAISRKPTTSLACLKAEWQAEAFWQFITDIEKIGWETAPALVVNALYARCAELRRQAEESTND